MTDFTHLGWGSASPLHPTRLQPPPLTLAQRGTRLVQRVEHQLLTRLLGRRHHEEPHPSPKPGRRTSHHSRITSSTSHRTRPLHGPSLLAAVTSHQSPQPPDPQQTSRSHHAAPQHAPPATTGTSPAPTPNSQAEQRTTNASLTSRSHHAPHAEPQHRSSVNASHSCTPSPQPKRWDRVRPRLRLNRTGPGDRTTRRGR